MGCSTIAGMPFLVSFGLSQPTIAYLRHGHSESDVVHPDAPGISASNRWSARIHEPDQNSPNLSLSPSLLVSSIGRPACLLASIRSRRNCDILQSFLVLDQLVVRQQHQHRREPNSFAWLFRDSGFVVQPSKYPSTFPDFIVVDIRNDVLKSIHINCSLDTSGGEKAA